MKRAAQQLQVFRGDDLRVAITMRDQSGQVLDISGAAEIEYAVAASVQGPKLLSKTLANGGISITAPEVFTLDLTSADTGSLSPGVYYHEAQIQTSTGETYTALYGSLTILTDLIRE